MTSVVFSSVYKYVSAETASNVGWSLDGDMCRLCGKKIEVGKRMKKESWTGLLVECTPNRNEFSLNSISIRNDLIKHCEENGYAKFHCTMYWDKNKRGEEYTVGMEVQRVLNQAFLEVRPGGFLETRETVCGLDLQVFRDVHETKDEMPLKMALQGILVWALGCWSAESDMRRKMEGKMWWKPMVEENVPVKDKKITAKIKLQALRAFHAAVKEVLEDVEGQMLAFDYTHFVCQQLESTLDPAYFAWNLLCSFFRRGMFAKGVVPMVRDRRKELCVEGIAQFLKRAYEEEVKEEKESGG